LQKKFKFLFFGAGANQYQFIRHSVNNKNYNIVIHNKKNFKEKKNVDEFVYGSVYKKNKILNLIKKIKSKKNLDDIICRSSGPSMISAYKVDKYFGIGRVSRNLAYCVYSKYFLYKFLKKKKIPHIRSDIIKKLNKKKYLGNWIIKPDAPIFGKRFVYKIENKQIDKKKFNIIKNASDNKKVNISKYIPGNDITAIMIIQKKDKKRIILNLINEWNFFYKNQMDVLNTKSVVGISAPPIRLQKKTLDKIKTILNKMINLFPKYYGLFVVSMRVNKEKIFAYEVNLNTDSNYAKIIFPNFYNGKSIFNLEINNLMNKPLGKFKITNKFVGTLGKLLIKNKKKYLNKFSKIEKLI
jgi:hypothetical protein